MSLFSRNTIVALSIVAASPLLGCDDLDADPEAFESDDLGLNDPIPDFGESAPPPTRIDELAPAPLELSQKPKLWAPFPSGKSYKCVQGPFGADTHNGATTRYGIDFDTPNAGAAEVVVAALAGTVAHVKTGCGLNDPNCGAGFGNHVKLSHGGNYYTIYGHLSAVSVAIGAKVGRGQQLGLEGNTGDSQGDHIHFSLHQGNAALAAVSTSVSYLVRDKDVTDNGAFLHRDASAHICDLTTGHFYQSDNVCTTVYNTTATAKPITNNTTYLGETCAVGDVDYFSFGGKAGPFTATIKSTTESISDCSCSILNPQGIELQQGGIEGYVRNDAYNGSEGCACSLTNASTSAYYLKVYSQMPGAYTFDKTLP